jgi:hypothetical protein
MKNNINVLSAQIQQLDENQDGTITGGFLSITGGRHRIVLDTDPPLQAVWDTRTNRATNHCAKTENSSCTNYDCERTANSGDCRNLPLVRNSGSGYSAQTY